MICKIADLITEVPDTDGLRSLCRDYLWSGTEAVDVAIRPEQYRPDKYGPNISAKDMEYMESARQFYVTLLHREGLYLHASAVELEGRVYLFSGNSGVGKSTHTRLWQQVFGESARIINDDKPALRCLDGVWYAYGTPWCGKEYIQSNRKAPLAGICFLKQAGHNAIRRLNPSEALRRLIPQTIHQFGNVQRLDLMLGHLDKLMGAIPIYELENRPEPAAARLSYETMRCGAEENGL